MTTYKFKNVETETNISVTSHKQPLTYHQLINQLIYQSKDLSVYISLKSIKENGLGKLINQIDVHREPFKLYHGKIRSIIKKYEDGYILFSDGFIYYASEPNDECNTIIVEW